MQTAEEIRRAANNGKGAWKRSNATGSAIPPDVDPEERMKRLGMVWASELDDSPPKPKKLNRLSPEASTYLYGPGGVGKTALAASWSGRITEEGDRVLILDYERNDGEWARRLDGLGGDRSKILYVQPMAPEWGGIRGPLWEAKKDILAICKDMDITYLVVDSVAFGCAGMKAEESTTAIDYNEGLQYIGLPSLNIAHVNRAADMSMPYGSAFWGNAARVAWSLEEKWGGQGGGSILTLRKANNYAKHGPYRVRIEWVDGKPMSIVEDELISGLADALEWHMEMIGAPATLKDILAGINEDIEEKSKWVKPDAARKAMQRDKRFIAPPRGPKDGKWGLVEYPMKKKEGPTHGF